jgi:hypothetical protein
MDMANTSGNHHIGHYTLGKPLLRSLCGDHVLVLCILPF